MFKSAALACIALLSLIATAGAQDQFCKVWYSHEKTSKIQIYRASDGKYYGKIVWLRDGIVNGQPLLDTKNPDESKRKQTLLGLQIITGLEKKSDNEIVGGKIYDPTHGNYYSCKMTIKVPGQLELRGYILGMPFLGRTTIWYLIEDEHPKEQKLISPPAGTNYETNSRKDL